MDNTGRTEERRIRKMLYLRDYRTTHKDELASKRSVKTTCTCGLEVSKRHIHEHMTTRNHANALKRRVEERNHANALRRHVEEVTNMVAEKTDSGIAQHIMTFL